MAIVMSPLDIPLVSVWMITYNHEKYIAQAIDSVLSQVTNFRLELVIGEDCSTDRTRQICDEYESKFPGIIKVLRHEKNVGIHQNFILTLQACKGEFVALLEGDDYWTDVNKLQRQVEFLIARPDYVMCYQKTLEIDEISGKQKITNEGDHEVTGVEELLRRGWFIRTGSLLFRNGLLRNFPKWFFDFSSTDYMLHILIAERGKIGFLNETTSVYRRHEGGVTQDFQSRIIAFNERKLKLLDLIDEYFGFLYHRHVRKQKKSIYNAIFISRIRRIARLKDVVNLFKLLPFVSHKYLLKRFFTYASSKIHYN